MFGATSVPLIRTGTTTSLPYPGDAFIYNRTIYIDPNGNDSNSGLTTEAPMLTLQAAAAKLGGYGQIMCRQGSYYNNGLNMATADMKQVKIRGYLTYYGKPRFYYGERITSGWTSEGSGVYSKVITTVIPPDVAGPPIEKYWVFDHDVAEAGTAITQANTHPLQKNQQYRLPHARLSQVTTLGAIAAGKFFYDSGTSRLYIKRTDSSSPEGANIWIPAQVATGGISPYTDNKSIITGGTGELMTVELENIEVFYAYRGAHMYGKHSVITKDCTFYGCSYAGLHMNLTNYSEEWNNEYAACGSDGVDYTGAESVDNFSQHSKHFSFNCWAHDCGDQGSSWHQQTSLYMYGGLVENNGNGGILGGIGNAVIIGVTTRNNVGSAGIFTGIGTHASGVEAYSSVEITNCISIGDVYGFASNGVGNAVSRVIVRGGSVKTPTAAAFYVTSGNIIDIYDVDVAEGVALKAGAGTLNVIPPGRHGDFDLSPSGVNGFQIFHKNQTDLNFTRVNTFFTAYAASPTTNVPALSQATFLDAGVLKYTQYESYATMFHRLQISPATFDFYPDGTLVLSKLSVSGVNLAYTAKTANYTATATDYTINCTSGTFTVTLPTAVGIAGKIYVIKNSGTGVITVDGDGAETIDGDVNYALSSQYESISVQSNGANWVII